MQLSNKSLEELYDIAENLNVKRVKSYSKDELVYKILDEQAIQGVNRPIQKKKRDRIVNPKLAKVDIPDKSEKVEAPAVPVEQAPATQAAPAASALRRTAPRFPGFSTDSNTITSGFSLRERASRV